MAAPLVRMRRLRHEHLLLVMVVMVITRITVASASYHRYLCSYPGLKGPTNEASTTADSRVDLIIGEPSEKVVRPNP